jgi:hypothetical protein
LTIRVQTENEPGIEGLLAPGVGETKSKTKIGGSNRGRNDDEG